MNFDPDDMNAAMLGSMSLVQSHVWVYDLVSIPISFHSALGEADYKATQVQILR